MCLTPARPPQDDLRELLRTKRLPDASPLLELHARMSTAAATLLASDTYERSYTRHLPSTNGMKEAVYNHTAFLAQLPEAPG